MAQNFQQLNTRGVTTGIKLLAGAGALAYGLSQSLYTGMQTTLRMGILPIVSAILEIGLLSLKRLVGFFFPVSTFHLAHPFFVSTRKHLSQ